jgi:hypothetical protein
MTDKTTAAHAPDVIPEAIAGDMLSALAGVRQIAPVTAVGTPPGAALNTPAFIVVAVLLLLSLLTVTVRDADA